ncbi:hypothetical protein YC2023_017745 [Brassica napus]
MNDTTSPHRSFTHNTLVRTGIKQLEPIGDPVLILEGDNIGTKFMTVTMLTSAAFDGVLAQGSTSLAYSSPNDDPQLNEEEKKTKTPVWALIISHFCHIRNIHTIDMDRPSPVLAPKAATSPTLGQGPALDMDAHILPSGLLRVLPWFTMAIFVHIGGWIGDTPMSRGGLLNTAGVLAGVSGTAATGYILQRGDVLKVAVYLIGAQVWNLFATGEEITAVDWLRVKKALYIFLFFKFVVISHGHSVVDSWTASIYLNFQYVLPNISPLKIHSPSSSPTLRKTLISFSSSSSSRGSEYLRLDGSHRFIRLFHSIYRNTLPTMMTAFQISFGVEARSLVGEMDLLSREYRND